MNVSACRDATEIRRSPISVAIFKYHLMPNLTGLIAARECYLHPTGDKLVIMITENRGGGLFEVTPIDSAERAQVTGEGVGRQD